MIGKTFLPILLTITAAFAQADSPTASRIVVPKAWSDSALAEWATPLPVLEVRPGFYSEAEFYKIPAATFYRSYPVYHPDHEPKGYWDWVQKQPPKLLIEPEKLRTENDWVEAGRIVFQELYLPPGIGSPELIAKVRSRGALEQAGIEMLPDGTLPLRWVVTPNGISLTGGECQGCHTRYLPDGTRIDGAPPQRSLNGMATLLQSIGPNRRERSDAQLSRVRRQRYAQWGVPWLKEDVHEGIKSMSWEEFDELLPFERQYHVASHARVNGSPFYPTKTLDLIGIRDRKYLDHTATHAHRDITDIMRYALLVACCDPLIFGSHQMRPPEIRLPRDRYTDELLFALAQYIYSLKPPSNPYARDPRAAEGKKVFEREQCGGCHTPPLYTNNKLTLAKGFTPPDDHPYKKDIMPISVGTDPGLALKTRKGTGFYRVPSLKGVWYRGLYGHHGDVASLEDWFDPARLREDYVPSGWKGYKTSRRAVPGHEFGLKLSVKDKQSLIAFLRSL